MRKLIFIFSIVLLLNLHITAQTKIYDVDRPIGELAAAGLDTLFVNLQNNPDSKGIIVIFIGSEKQNIGNVKGIIEGVKNQEHFRAKGQFINRISFIMVEGKK